MSEAQAAQRDESPMDVDQPSPLEQDPAPLGMTHFKTPADLLLVFLTFSSDTHRRWARCHFFELLLFYLFSAAVAEGTLNGPIKNDICCIVQSWRGTGIIKNLITQCCINCWSSDLTCFNIGVGKHYKRKRVRANYSSQNYLNKIHHKVVKGFMVLMINCI